MRLKLFVLLFWLSFQSYAQRSDFAHVNFNKADSIAKVYGEASLRNMPLLVHQLTKDLDTQVEQFRAIHTWVCLNIESDHYFSEATLKKGRALRNKPEALKKWNAKTQAKVYKRLLRDKKTICTGYAYILKALTVLAEIECEIVDGYARTTAHNIGTVDFPNHSWNVLKLNDKWYFADATQASGYYNLDEEKFVKDYNDGYFLADPQLFVQNHFPINRKWLLLGDDELSLIDFVKTPLIYGDTYKYGIIPKTPTGLVTSINVGESVIFRFKLLDPSYLEKISLVLISGFKFKKIKPTKSNYKNGVLELKCQFDKKGQYDVHAKVDKAIVASYTVKVEKTKNRNPRSS
ncbi:hypothetical protein H7U19_14535 [Hyunsoonleella sp. SJ7]|uniref:Transglutaminase-like domain-containing protein n=1 Tax=Hyunsoonleella aquatilis TaxID=2762758 RepID=A0A923HHX8_9FLAO|nr:hypothetical protein [Hyunsoonleella aquatilis]MBC3759630.1 hypothetical protein [Hyunsoonleella aquatilis]